MVVSILHVSAYFKCFVLVLCYCCISDSLGNYIIMCSKDIAYNFSLIGQPNKSIQQDYQTMRIL